MNWLKKTNSPVYIITQSNVYTNILFKHPIPKLVFGASLLSSLTVRGTGALDEFIHHRIIYAAFLAHFESE